MLTDRDANYCGQPDRHPYELYFAVENIDHPRTKTTSPPTDGIFERFSKTSLNEFYRVTFRKRLYWSLADLQRDYNTVRPHRGRWSYGKTPMQTFVDALPLAFEKLIA